MLKFKRKFRRQRVNKTSEQHKSLYESSYISQNQLHYQHNFSLVRETLYAGRVNLFAAASELVTDALAGSSRDVFIVAVGDFVTGLNSPGIKSR